MLVVDDVEAFHQANLQINSKHYSSMKFLGPKTLAKFQERWGARVYFNTLVPYRHGVRYPFIKCNYPSKWLFINMLTLLFVF